MAAATLSYANHQLADQAWSSESSLITTKSQDSNPDWGQNDNSAIYSGGEPNPSNKSPTQGLHDNPTAEDIERDELLFSQEEKNREIRECLKSMQSHDDPDKAHWAYFKTLLEQEGQEKAQLAYLNYIKNERIFACLQAYRAQEEKYNWNLERQKFKDEQMSQFRQMSNLEEVLQNNRMNQQANYDIDYFKNKWESYIVPSHTGVCPSPDMYREIVQKGRQALLSSQENLELLQHNYSQYNNLVQENQNNGHIHSTSVQDILEADGSKYYYNPTNVQVDPKLQSQYVAQVQKAPQPAAKKVGNKGESNALDDVMADFQANGRDSTAPPSPRTTRAWGGVPPTPRPSLQNIRHLMTPSSGAASVPVNPLLTNPLARSTEADLLRQLMLMNLGASSAQLQKQQQLYAAAPQAYGFPLGSLADGQFRQRRRVTITPTECAFCRNNGEQPAVYRGHILKDAEGRVRCPILRDYTCRNCGATGDMAHTVKYCPLTPKTVAEKFAYGQRQEAGFPFRPTKVVRDQSAMSQSNMFTMQNP